MFPTKVLVALAGLAAALAFPAAADDWPAWRGPQQDGTAGASEAFRAEHVALEVVWRRAIGSAYSGISVAGDTGVTMAAEGESDWLVAFDAATGEERWRLALSERYVGHDGSEDGPSSTPVIGGDVVYALGARGRLVAVGLADGKLRWERAIEGELGATAAGFGFVTTPLVAGEVLVVATGGEAGAFTAFDRASGAVRWRAGADGVEYQSPVLASLAGQSVILAPGNDLLTGLDPATGREVWRLDYGPRSRYSTSSVVALPDDRLLLNPWPDTALYRVVREGEAWRFEEAWRASTLDARLATSVWHDGHVYGFDGNFLTCVDGATGQKVWKSRPPGGSGLILVEGNLVVLGQDGSLVLVRATPEGYRERARVEALDAGGVTYPSFAGDRILVRNTREIAALTVRPLEAASGSSPAAAPAGGVLAELAEAVRRSDTPRLVVDDFLRRADRLPLIEGREQVHFVWRGRAEDVGIESAHLGWEEEPLTRLAGTDLWYLSARLEPDQRVEYRFNVDFDRVGPDPANPHRVPAEWGEDYSLLAMPQAIEPEWLRAWRGDSPGTLERIAHASAALDDEREVTVWVPPGHRPGSGAGLLLVTEGAIWLDKGMLLDVLRQRVGIDVAPLVVAFVGSPRGGEDLAGPSASAYVAMLADELVPALTARFGLSDRAADRAVLGRWSGAYAAIVSGLERPAVFGSVAATSLLARDALDALQGRIAATEPTGVRFHISWNRYERWEADAMSRAVRDSLRSQGHTVGGGQRPESAGWSGFRAWAGAVLAELFPRLERKPS